MRLTEAEADMIVKQFLKRGCDHVTPRALPIVATHPETGEQLEDEVPRALVYDGSTVVLDFCLEASGTHDWGYLYGKVAGVPFPKKWWDAYYRDIHLNRGFKAIARIRYAGLAYVPPTCWISNAMWKRNRQKNLSKEEIMRQWVLPDAEHWMFPNGSWMLKDAVYMGVIA